MNSKYVYWGATALIALFSAFSGTMYFVADAPAETIQRLGYPDYFHVLLGVGKIVGAIGVLAPLPRSMKEWVYAGFTFDFTAAIISHIMAGDPVSSIVMPLVALALLLTSYAAYHSYVLGSEEAVEV